MESVLKAEDWHFTADFLLDEKGVIGSKPISVSKKGDRHVAGSEPVPFFVGCLSTWLPRLPALPVFCEFPS
jgi:hypothetical protein